MGILFYTNASSRQRSHCSGEQWLQIMKEPERNGTQTHVQRSTASPYCELFVVRVPHPLFFFRVGKHPFNGFASSLI